MGPSALPEMTLEPTGLARLRCRYRRRHPLRPVWGRREWTQCFQQLVSLVCVLSMVWSGTSPLWVPDPAEAQTLTQQATLTVISQPVEVQRSSGARVDGASGMTVSVGDRIITGTGGAGTLTFFQGAEMEIGENAEIMVQQMEQRGGAGGASTVGIGQAIGNTVSRVASLFNPASRFQVTTPSAVAVVRGTTLGVGVDANKLQVFTCTETKGTCDVTSGGQTQKLKEGESTFILPPPPTPAAPPTEKLPGGGGGGDGGNQNQSGFQDQKPATPIPAGQLQNAIRTAEATYGATVVMVTLTPISGLALATSTPGVSGTPGASGTPGGTGTPVETRTPGASPTPAATATPEATATSVPATPTPVPQQQEPPPVEVVVAATPTSTPTPTRTPVPNFASATVAAGATASLSTSTQDGPSLSDAVQTTLHVPASTAGGTVSIDESGALTRQAAGYTLFGQQVVISAPAATATDPLRLVLRVAAEAIQAQPGVPAGYTADVLEVFRNGVKIEACTATPPSAISPDPCRSQRTRLADGDVEVTVLTSQASDFNAGIALPATSTPTPTPSPSTTPSPTATPTGTIPPNTQPGTNVSVSVGSNTTVRFGSVSAAGDATVGASASTAEGLSLPSGTTLLNGQLYTLSTTASVSGDLTVEVVFGAAFSGVRPAGDVQLQFRDGNGQWVIPSQTVNASTYTVSATIPSGTTSLGTSGGDEDGAPQSMHVSDAAGATGTLGALGAGIEADGPATGEVTRLFMRATSAMRAFVSTVVEAVGALVAPRTSEAAEIATATPVATATPTVTPTATSTATATRTATATTTATASARASASATGTASPTASPTATVTATVATAASETATPPTTATATTAATTAATTTATTTVAPTATPSPLQSAAVTSSTLLVFVVALPPQQKNTLSLAKSGTGTGTISTADVSCGPACTAPQYFDYVSGTSVSVSAVANTDSTFTGWGGACAGFTTSQPCSVTMDVAKNATANFDLVPTVTHAVDILKSGDGSGTVTSSPAGLSCGTTCSFAFDSNQLVTLTAVPSGSDTFGGWVGGLCGGLTTPSCSFTVTAPTTVTATFNAPVVTHTLSVALAGTGSGMLSSSPSGITCPTTCTFDYVSGTAVTLNALVSSGSSFTGWSGDCAAYATSTSCSLTMLAGKSATATFDLLPTPTYAVSVAKSGDGAGTVTSSPTGLDCGTTCTYAFDSGQWVTLTAIPSGSDTFGGWSGGLCTGTATTCGFTVTMADTVIATFNAPVVTHTLSVAKTGDTSAATLYSSPSGIECGATCTAGFTSGQSVTLTYNIHTTNTVFSGWSGACTGTGACSVTMDAAKSVSADFQQVTPTYTLNLTKSGLDDGPSYGTVTSDPSGITCGATCTASFELGQVVTLTASVADPSAAFLAWYGDCLFAGSSSTCALTIHSTTVNVGATFQGPPTGTYAAAVLSDSPIAYYRLGEVTGTRAVDGSGNSRTGAYTGVTLQISPDAILSDSTNAAASFGGTGYAAIANGPSLANQSFSVEAWAKRSSSGGHDWILWQGTTNQDNGLTFGFFQDNRFVFSFYYSDLFSTDAYTDSDWHHWVGTYDAVTNARKLYRDGQLIASDTAAADFQGSGELRISNGDHTNFDGALDEVAVYPGALSASRIQAHYTAAGYSLPTTHTLSVSTTGSGTVTSGDSFISCPVSCSYAYASGTAVALTANPTSASTFSGWSGTACSGVTSTTCSLTITTPASVTATFASVTQTIAYNRADGTIWFTTLDGAQGGQFTTGFWPRLSPDGRYLAFLRDGTPVTPTYGSSIYVRDLLTASETRVFHNPTEYIVNFGWTADSAQIVFDYWCDIKRMNRDGSSVTTLIAGSGSGCYNDAPSVRASDGQLAYHNNQSGGGLLVASANGSSPQAVPNTQPDDYIPFWSPDGQWLSFVRGPVNANNRSQGHIYKIKPDGTSLTCLTCALGGTPTATFYPAAAWTAGGARLVAAGTVNAIAGLYSIAADGTGAVQIPITAGSAPDWAGSVTTVPYLAATTPTYQLTVTRAGATSADGTVTSNLPGISCGATCTSATHAFDAGQTVTLTATAGYGATFQGWSGGTCSGTAPCAVTLHSATAVTATFAYATGTVPLGATWNPINDLRHSPSHTPTNPNPDSYGNGDVWRFLAVHPGSLDNPAAYATMTSYTTTGYAVSGIKGWAAVLDQDPMWLHNTTGVTHTYHSSAIEIPPGALMTHPGSISNSPVINYAAVLGWKSPVSGTVSIAGALTDRQTPDDSGVAWFVKRNTTTLANGISSTAARGVSYPLSGGTNGASLSSVQVAVGDVIYLIVDQNGSPNNDTNEVELTITYLGDLHTLTVATAGSGSGYVSNDPYGITCGTTCTASFTSGQGVTLTATADSGSTFAGWSGACSGTAACSPTLNSGVSVTAIFESTAVSGTYAQAVMADAPLVYYRLGETVATSAYDVSGHAVTATYTGAVTRGVADALLNDSNAAARFNGVSNGHVESTSTLHDVTGTALTVETWVSMTVGQNAGLVYRGRFDNTRGSYSLHTDNNGRFYLRLNNGALDIGTPLGYIDGAWHHVVATYDGAVASIYVDGAQVVSQTYTTPVANNFAGTILYVGAYYNTGFALNGSLDEVAIYNTALSRERIQAHYAAAAYTVPTQTLTVTKAGSGTVTGDPSGINCGTTCTATFNHGQVVTLTAVADSGWAFSSWSSACSGTTTCTVNMSAAQAVTATFTTIPTVTTLYVSTTGNDTGNSCLSTSAPCATVGRAISQASSGNVISVASGTYTEHLQFGTSLTVVGEGPTTILQGDGTGGRPVLVNSGSTVSLSSLTIRNGNPSSGGGGGILNNGTLTLSYVSVTNNSSGDNLAEGGAIKTTGSLVVSHSTISSNTSVGGGGAIAITSSAVATLTNTTITGNSATATSGGGGGGVTNRGTAYLTDVTISGNTTAGGNGGGGIYSPGALTLERVSVVSNTSSGGYAGGLLLESSGSLTDVAITGNSGWNIGGVMLIGGPAGVSLTRVLVANSTLTTTSINNIVGGMFIGPNMTADLINTTLSANSPGGAGATNLSNTGTTTLTNVTVYGSASSSVPSVGSNGGTLTLKNTTLANGGLAGNCSGPITSAGNNLSSDLTCTLGSGDQTDALLGSLANNGGFTHTHALLGGSPALDAGTNTGCPSTDQRGVLRPQGSKCDIGAYEHAVPTTLDDGFGAAPLSEGWFWVRQSPSNWSLTSGALRIMTQTGDLYSTYNNVPVLLRAVSGSDYTVEAKVTMDPVNQYQQAGLVLYSSDDNYVKLMFVKDPGDPTNRSFHFGKEETGTFTAHGLAAPSGTTFYLKIAKAAQTFTAYYSTDGTSWTEVSPSLTSTVVPAYAGISAFNGGGNTYTSIPADFDYFRIGAVTTVDESFGATSLSNDWHWVRGNASLWSLTAVTGSLRITAAPGDLHTGTNTAPVLLRAAPSGTLELQTKVSFSPFDGNQQAGLIVYADDGNYVRFTRAHFGANGHAYQIGNEIGGLWTPTDLLINSPPTSTATDHYMKLVKSGTSYTASYSLDGTSWTTVGTVTSSISPTYVGLTAFTGPGANIDVDFDYFKLTES